MKLTTNKGKLYLSIFFILIFGYICCRIAIVPTIAKYKEYQLLKKEVVLFGTNPAYKIKEFEKRIANYNRFLIKDLSNQDSNVLSFISENEGINKISIASLPEKHIFSNHSSTIITYRLKLTGDFKGLLKYLNFLELSQNQGKILSVHYFINSFRGGVEVLYLEVYLQYYLINNSTI